MSKKHKAGDIVQTEHGPAIVTSVSQSGMLSVTIFRPDAHPTWGLILNPKDLK